MERIKLGTTDRTIVVFIPDSTSTDGSGKTGLVAANLTVSYTRVETDNDVTVTDVTSSLSNLSALTDAHADWGLKEVSSTLAPGFYRLDVADAVFAAGAWYAYVYTMVTTSAAAATPMGFTLVTYDPGESVTQTGDSYAIVNSGSFGNAVIKTDTAAILVDTGTTLDARIPAALVSGRIDASVGAIAANAITAASMNSDAGGEIADAVWDEAMSGHVTSGTFGQRSQGIRSGTAQAGGASTITLDASASASNDFYDGMVFLTGGTGAGQSRAITDYVGATKVATVYPNWITNPSSDSVFVLLPVATVSTPTASEIVDAVWEEAIADHSGTVGSTAEQLAAAGAAGDPWDTAVPGAYAAGKAGYILGTNVNATVSSRASQTSVDDLPTNAELATSQAAADDATLAAIADVEGKVDDLETRLPQTLSDKLVAHAAAVLTMVVDAGSTATSVVFKTVNNTTPSATSDYYNNRVIIYTSGALAGQAVEITDYVGGTVTATTSASTAGPAEDVTAVIV